MLVCAGETILYLIGRARWHAITAALTFAAAITIKYTALALVPVLGLLVLGCAWFGLGRYAGMPRKRALGAAAMLALLVAGTGLLGVNAIYRFDRTGMRVDHILELPEPMNQITRGYNDPVDAAFNIPATAATLAQVAGRIAQPFSAASLLRDD